MNTCPVYRRSGGYSYSYFIPGPIGINLGMLHDPQKHNSNEAAVKVSHANGIGGTSVDLGIHDDDPGGTDDFYRSFIHILGCELHLSLDTA